MLTAVPVDEPALPVAPIELVARFRTAFAATELIEVFCADETTVPATALVVCEPLAGPPEVLTYTSFNVCGFCEYGGATSMIT